MRTLIVTLLGLLLLAGPCAAQGETTYFGNTGSKKAVFILRWPAKGRRVTGYYYTTDRPRRRYVLTGENYQDGRLVLHEHTRGKETAVLRLRKSTPSGRIRWSGTMHNTDGRKIPVQFGRDR